MLIALPEESAKANFSIFAVSADKVEVTGPDKAKAGDELEFECKTGNSNPASLVTWMVDGVDVPGRDTVSTPDADGGMITSSKLTVRVGPSDRRKNVDCYARNDALGDTIQERRVVDVLCESSSGNGKEKARPYNFARSFFFVVWKNSPPLLASGDGG